MRVSMKEAVQKYLEHLVNLERRPKTIKGYGDDLMFWRSYLEELRNGPVMVNDLDEDSILNFLLHLKQERQYKPASRRRLAAVIRGFLGYCQKQKQQWLTEDLAAVVPQIQVPQSERTYLKPEEVQRWADEVEHSLVKVVMWTLYYCGLRISEAVNLRLEDVTMPDENGEGGWVYIHDSKGGKHRRIPMTSKLVPVLEEHLKRRVDSEYFFATAKTGRITTQHVQAHMRHAREQLGWDADITPHVLRHSFASHLYKQTGGNILAVSKLLGHSKLSTTQIYTHLNEDQMVEAIKQF